MSPSDDAPPRPPSVKAAAIVAEATGTLPPVTPVPYEEVRHAIREGDVLLFRGRGLVSALIGGFGRSKYSHAALVVALRQMTGPDRLVVTEFRELRGGRVILLSKAVEGADVDLYRVEIPGEGKGPEAAAFLRASVGGLAWRLVLEAHPYGYWSIIRLLLGRLPLFLLRRLPFIGKRLPFRTWSDDDAIEPKSFVCSVFVAYVWRKAGLLDLVPRLADDSTEPGDLARSARLEFAGTLTPEQIAEVSR